MERWTLLNPSATGAQYQAGLCSSFLVFLFLVLTRVYSTVP